MNLFQRSAESAKGLAGFRWRPSTLGVLTLNLIALVGFYLIQSSFDFFPPAAPLAGQAAATQFQTHYLLDLEYSLDEQKGFGRLPHLSVFNPGSEAALLNLTVFFEEHEPQSFQLSIPGLASLETNATTWPVPLNSRFGLKIESTQPVLAQVTQGWNNTRNDYSLLGQPTNSPFPRETAKSYISQTALGRECYVADGMLINAPDEIWLKETEDVIILNPGSEDLDLTITIYFGERRVTRFQVPLEIPVLKKQVRVPAERFRSVSLTDWLKANWHYGARLTAERPFAAQWLRQVYWYDSPELMSEWSVPCVHL